MWQLLITNLKLMLLTTFSAAYLRLTIIQCLMLLHVYKCLHFLQGNELPFGRDTRVVPSGPNIVLDSGTGPPTGKGVFGGQNTVKICIANCGQTVAGNGKAYNNSAAENVLFLEEEVLWDQRWFSLIGRCSSALSNRTIADPTGLLLSEITQCRLVPNDFGACRY